MQVELPTLLFLIVTVKSNSNRGKSYLQQTQFLPQLRYHNTIEFQEFRLDVTPYSPAEVQSLYLKGVTNKPRSWPPKVSNAQKVLCLLRVLFGPGYGDSMSSFTPVNMCWILRDFLTP
jgi:hypothetical protein